MIFVYRILGHCFLFALVLTTSVQAEPLADLNAALATFTPGSAQEARFLELATHIDDDSFVIRSQAEFSLRNFPSVPADTLARAREHASAGVQYRLDQFAQTQSPVRTLSLLRKLFQQIQQTPANIDTANLLRVIAHHEQGLYVPLAQRTVIAATSPEAITDLKNYLTHTSALVRICAGRAIAHHAPDRAQETLIAQLEDPDHAVRFDAAFLLVNQEYRPALHTLIALTDASSDLTRWQAKQLLSRVLDLPLPDEGEPRTNFSTFWTEWLERNPNAVLNIPQTLPSDIPLFEDEALSGWVEIFNGQRQEIPKAWSYSDGVLHCTGEGSGYLVTHKKFKNYLLRVEWQSKGDSGVGVMAGRQEDHVRGEPPYIEVQTLPGAVGDLYTIGSFTADNAEGKAITFRQTRTAAPPENERWYRMQISVRNGEAEFTVNDVVVNKIINGPAKPGHIVLRNEGDPVSFRNLVIMPLD